MRLEDTVKGLRDQGKHYKEIALELKLSTRQVYHMANKSNVKIYKKRYESKVKREVLTHYGNGKLACLHCGFSDIRALSIDHIINGGKAHRKEIKRPGGIHFYSWLKVNDYPLGFQTLCLNCQWIKRIG